MRLKWTGSSSGGGGEPVHHPKSTSSCDANGNVPCQTAANLFLFLIFFALAQTNENHTMTTGTRNTKKWVRFSTGGRGQSKFAMHRLT
jgi:hypothetical protein